MDPRRPIATEHPDGLDVRRFVYDQLLDVTGRSCQALKVNGVSFINVAMGIWAAEMAEIEPRSAAKYLRALADIFDPESSETKKQAAEQKRKAAFQALAHAADLQMATPEGKA